MTWAALSERIAESQAALFGEDCMLRSSLTGQTGTATLVVAKQPGDIQPDGGFELQTVADGQTSALPWVPSVGDLITLASGRCYVVDGWRDMGDGMTRMVLREDTR